MEIADYCGCGCRFIGVVAAVLARFAIYNLNVLIERNQTRILRLVSEALQRPIQVDEVSARAGWGVWIEISGLKIAEGAAFGQLPFFPHPTPLLRSICFRFFVDMFAFTR